MHALLQWSHNACKQVCGILTLLWRLLDAHTLNLCVNAQRVTCKGQPMELQP